MTDGVATVPGLDGAGCGVDAGGPGRPLAAALGAGLAEVLLVPAVASAGYYCTPGDAG